MIEVQTEQAAEPRTRRWSREEYYQMYDLGWFQGQRVELVDGEIIEMAPQRNPHVVAIDLLQEALRAAFGSGYWIRMQAPLHFGPRSEPEPDAAVVRGKSRDYQDHPTTALLVVEISEATLRYDARRKASLYASAGIEDYWIVNLVDQRLEVRRHPIPDEQEPFGHRYADVTLHPRGDSVSPLARPQARVAVADLLP